jgi:integrase
MANAIQGRGARDIAKRALETVGQVFRYGIAHGLATRNPATEIRPSDILKSTPKTNYARIDAKELPTLLRRIEVYQGKQVTRLAMKLTAMTFVRITELIGAKWGSPTSDSRHEATLNRSLYKLKTSRSLMRQMWPQPSVSPGTHECAHNSRNHYGHAVADERKERSGASTRQGPTQPKDRAAGRVAYAAA